MTIKYGLQFFFFELTDNDGQNFLSAIVLTQKNTNKKMVRKLHLFTDGDFQIGNIHALKHL
jgi:hypothetical protein